MGKECSNVSQFVELLSVYFCLNLPSAQDYMASGIGVRPVRSTVCHVNTSEAAENQKQMVCFMNTLTLVFIL